MSGPRIGKVVIPGVYSLDGQDFHVENNVWLVGDDDEVLVIDAPHDPAPIVEATGGRKVVAIVLTHGHNDHITAAPALREATGAPIWFHSADRMLWDKTHADAEPDRELQTRHPVQRRGHPARGLAHAGPLAGQHLPARGRLGHRVHRRHTALRRTGGNRP